MDYYYLYTTTTPSTASGSSSFPPKNNNARDKKKKKKKEVPAGNNNNNNKMIKTNNNNGVKLSTDPQSVAARERRHRISDRFKILQSLVPGGTKMDTVSMLEETINYVKFLKTQIFLHQSLIMDLDHHDPHNLLNYNYQIPTVPSLSHPQQVQPSCCSNLEHSSFVITGSVQPPSTTSYLPLIDSCFQGEDSVRCDHAYVNNNSHFS